MSVIHTALQSSPKQAPPGCKISALPACACDISGKILSHLAVRACCPSGGVFFSSQELWKATQWFTIATMQDLGMGKHPGEERVPEELVELHFLIELIKSFRGELDVF